MRFKCGAYGGRKTAIERGFYFAPSQFEAAFLSSEHGDADVAATIQAAGELFAKM